MSDNGSDSGSGSEGTSGSDSGSESTSSEEIMLQPVYLKKSQRSKTRGTTKEPTAKNFNATELVEEETDEFGGVDDTDDLDPELEFNQWKQRELQRYQRDREYMKQIEDELIGKNETEGTTTTAPSGVFYNDESFAHLKRDFSKVEKLDHSRPLKRSEYMK